MDDSLASLDRSVLKNSSVKIISSKKGGRIRLSKLEPQPEPANLLALKAELAIRWPIDRENAIAPVCRVGAGAASARTDACAAEERLLLAG
jgi:hypothetical protein